MPKIPACSRADLVQKLKRLGFDGPFAGGKHQFMKRGNYRLTIPNPHGKQVDSILIREILKQAAISVDEWSKA